VRAGSAAPAESAASPFASLLGASSIVFALMLSAGFIHGSAYFGYFHLELSSNGLDPLELVLRNLRLATLPALAVLAVLAVALRFPELLAPLGVPAAVVARHGT
jgi:hypothetical protein